MANRKETNEGFAEMRAEMSKGFAEMHSEMREGFARVDKRFEKVDDRFEAMYRMLVAGGIVLLAAVIGALLT